MTKEEIIQAIASEKQYFIARVPQKLKEAKTIFASTAEVNWVNLSNDYAGAWFESCYGGVPQRWLLVRSQQAKP